MPDYSKRWRSPDSKDWSTDRRSFLRGLALTGAAVSLGGSVAWASTVKLPTPRIEGGVPIMEVFAKRRSIRAFEDRPVPQQMLSDALWAAFGINRPDTDDHTAPSWHSSKETDIYVATADGVWFYDPKAHELRETMTSDIRERTSSMVFAATAPVVLVYVADTNRMGQVSPEDKRLYAHVDSAIVAENVYLYAAAAGLGTVILGSVDRPALAKTLGLRDGQIVTFSQPIGFPK
ncbi:MAG: nitroreductase family protein [Alphaproteobacteria bacterium]